jgi:glutathione S-transferase
MAKLYFAPGACSLSPHIVLRETGTPFSMVKVDLAAKKTEDGGDFWTKNPGGYVPALEADDGTMITEGPVIVQYLADKAGKLAPKFGSPERYKMMSWLNYITSELHKGFSPLFNVKVQDESKSVLRDRLKHRLGVVDKHLAKNDFLMGKDFTVADAYLFTVLNWTKRPVVAIDLAKDFPNLAAFSARVAARPHVQEAMKAEGIA